MAGVQLVQSVSGKLLNEKLWARVAAFQSATRNAQSAIASAIIPLIIGDETKTIGLASKLFNQNIFIPAIRYPTVARGAARLRITFTAAHTAKDVVGLLAAIKMLNK